MWGSASPSDSTHQQPRQARGLRIDDLQAGAASPSAAGPEALRYLTTKSATDWPRPARPSGAARAWAAARVFADGTDAELCSTSPATPAPPTTRQPTERRPFTPPARERRRMRSNWNRGCGAQSTPGPGPREAVLLVESGDATLVRGTMGRPGATIVTRHRVRRRRCDEGRCRPRSGGGLWSRRRARDGSTGPTTGPGWRASSPSSCASAGASRIPSAGPPTLTTPVRPTSGVPYTPGPRRGWRTCTASGTSPGCRAARRSQRVPWRGCGAAA